MNRNFLLKLIGLTLVLAGILYFYISNSFFDGFREFSWMSLGFLAILTTLVYAVIMRGMKMSDPKFFMAAFGVAFGTKFFGSFVFLSYFIFFAPIANKNFIVPFFVMYFLYTGLLVSEFWRLRRGVPSTMQ